MQDVVTVNVGSKPEKYIVHSGIISNTSKFFNNCLKPAWSASHATGDIDLTDEDPVIFGIYLNWVYCKTLPTIITGDGTDGPGEYDTLSECYVMGERLFDIDFKNDVMDAFVEAMHRHPFDCHRSSRTGPVDIIYGGTPEGSPARRLIVEL